MDAVNRVTALGASVKMRGELIGEEDISISGDFDGIIRLSGARLTVGPEARVRANIEAQDVIIYGKVEGEIHALGLVSLRQDAVMAGDVFAAKFSMEEGTALRGAVDPTRAGEPLPPLQVSFSAAAAKPAARPVAAPAVSTHGEGRPVFRLEPEAVPAAPQSLFTPAENASVAASRMPAGLAAAARHFDEVVGASNGQAQGSESESQVRTALAETKG